MNDLERKVKQFLNDDAADAHHAARLPDGMAKRIRRHQARTALVAGAAAIAIVAVSIVGFRALLPLADDRQTPAGQGLGGTGPRVASLPLAQIEVPDGWWLTDLSAVKSGGPAAILQMSNYPPDLGATEPTLSCGASSNSASNVPDGGATVVIGEGNPPNFLLLGGSLPAQPKLEPSPISCARQLTAAWSPTSNIGDLHWAVATLGPDGPDPSVIQAALDSLKYPGEYPEIKADSPAPNLPLLWIGQGDEPQPWSLMAYGGQNASLIYSRQANGSLGPDKIATTGPARGFGALDTGADGTLYGTVSPDAASIALELPDGSAIPGQLLPVPDDLWGPSQAFVLQAGSSADSGSLVVRDATGAVVGRVPLSNGGSTADPEGMLRTGILAADQWFADHGTYDGFTPQEASRIDPSLNWTARPTNRRGDTVDITFARGDGLLLNAYASSGRVACAAHASGGDTSIQPVSASTVADCEPDAAAQTQLRYAIATAKTFYTDGDTYVGLTPETAAEIEPSVAFNTTPDAKEGEVSIRDVSAQTVLLVTRASNGDVFCLADDAQAGTTYGTTDAQTMAECSLDSWPALSSSPAVPTPSGP